METHVIDNWPIVVSGKLFRTAKVRDEPYECLANPRSFVERLGQSGLRADLFTFSQPISDQTPRHDYHLEWDSYSVLKLTTFEHWWKSQINDKTRNMIRKCQKKGVELRTVPYTDDLVRGIVSIYNESPIIQGKPNRHYGRDFESMKQIHGTFLEQSIFVGAYHQEELVGFIKLVFIGKVGSLMSIMSKVAHRDKAPSNGLIGRAVELCTERHVGHLHYGIWSRRTLGDFKKHHAFEKLDVPRYYVPLNARGHLMLSLKLHRRWSEHLPDGLFTRLANLRDQWNAIRSSPRKD